MALKANRLRPLLLLHIELIWEYLVGEETRRTCWKDSSLCQCPELLPDVLEEVGREWTEKLMENLFLMTIISIAK